MSQENEQKVCTAQTHTHTHTRTHTPWSWSYTLIRMAPSTPKTDGFIRETEQQRWYRAYIAAGSIKIHKNICLGKQGDIWIRIRLTDAGQSSSHHPFTLRDHYRSALTDGFHCCNEDVRSKIRNVCVLQTKGNPSNQTDSDSTQSRRFGTQATNQERNHNRIITEFDYLAKGYVNN